MGRLAGLAGIIPFGAALIVIFDLPVQPRVSGGRGHRARLGPAALAISRTPRYRAIERRLHEQEASFPNFVLDLRRVDSVAGVVGGHFVVG